MQPFVTLPDALSPPDCARIVARAAAAPLRDAGLVGGVTAHDLRRADLVWLDDLPDTGWVMDRMTRMVADANARGFGFDLTDFAESPQVARYDADRQGHFDWHSDIGTGPLAARRKLTIVLQLSSPDDYAGGTLALRPNNRKLAAPLDRGTAIVFPSFVLHRVSPVTEGVRWSLTLWAHGPAFR